MTDWNLAAKIFFGIAAGCVVLIALIAMVRSRPLWSFIAWVVKGIWHRLVDGVKFLFNIVINIIIVWFVSALIFIVFLIPISLLNPRYKPSDIGEGLVWIALAYLLYRVKKLEDRLESLQSLRRDNQPNHLDQPPDHSPH